jgi:hypothetical protein
MITEKRNLYLFWMTQIYMERNDEVRDIFSKTEKRYIRNKREIRKKNWGSLERRIKEKLNSLNNEEVKMAMFHFLDEDEKLKILNNMLSSLKMVSVENKFLKNYKKFQNDFTDALRHDDSNNLKYSFNNHSLWQTKAMVDTYKRNNSKVDALKILREPLTIAMMKIGYDLSTIEKLPLRMEIFLYFINEKRPIKIKDVAKKFKGKKDETILKEFYNLGVILKKGIDKNDFLKRCKKEFDKKEKDLEIKKWNLKYLFYPYEWKKDNEEDYAVINPLYKKFYLNDKESRQKSIEKSDDNDIQIIFKKPNF